MDSSRVPAAERMPHVQRLGELVRGLVELGEPIEPAAAAALLERVGLRLCDVAPFVEENARGYARRRVARTDAFEVLVLTWRPGQSSPPHDHAGSLCAQQVLCASLRETRFAPAADGFVDAVSCAELTEGEVAIDASPAVHALAHGGDASEIAVSLHVYAPPLRELRRHALRPPGAPAPTAFRRRCAAAAPVVAVIGAGFSGTLAAAQLLERASAAGRRLHVVLFERHCALGEGAAYRTPDPRHLLNVPAAHMSAWPERPSDFLDWARERDPSIAPCDFLPRALYGEYLRSRFLEVAARVGEGVSAELRPAEVRSLERAGESCWRVGAVAGDLQAAAVVLASGVPPPDDPLAGRWRGSCARYVRDPWASLALACIEPDEPVLLLGSGLTALDVLATLCETPRTAPITAVSRHGLLPQVHRSAPGGPLDPGTWLAPLLAARRGPSLRALTRELRAAIAAAAERGADWRAVIDGLRPHVPAIWRSLAPEQAARFVRHARPFWEVARHRVPPRVDARARELSARGAFRVIAGRVRAVCADEEGATVELRRRASAQREARHVAWVVNCTGIGACRDASSQPLLAALIEAGRLVPDPLGLGVLTDEEGRALGRDRSCGALWVVGALRRAQLWESTAVPELRVQAAAVARAVLARLG